MSAKLRRTVGTISWTEHPLRAVPLIAVWFVVHSVVVERSAAAQERGVGIPTVFTIIEGRWEGEGVLLGRPAGFTMRWAIEAQGFVRLTFSNAWVDEDGGSTPVLSSEAVYFPRGSSALGVWVDDRPQRLTLDATLTDSTLTTEWKAEAEDGRTEYWVRSADVVVARDFVYVDGSERLFAEATFRRAHQPPG